MDRRGVIAGALLWVGVLGCGGRSGSSEAGSTGSEATGDETTAASAGTDGTSGPADGTYASSTADASSDDAAPMPGEDVSVVAFEGAHVYWLGWDEGQNQRDIDTEVAFPPADLDYAQIVLELTLGCPDGRCDWWDRAGYIGVVVDEGTEDERVFEVARFVTPYRVGGTWVIDVTRLRPLLSDRKTLRVHIDTWVGPGHANGDGWLVDARFDFTGGVPRPRPIAVIPLWHETSFEVGDPAKPVADSVPPVTVDVPGSSTHVELVSLITGHGQGNLYNCAEFCPMVHGFLVGSMPWQREIWRDDCADNPIDGQQGTWMYDRAGWCPGADVLPWVEDVTAAVTPGRPVEVRYDLQSYENTCRPDSPVCMGCALGTGCEYDGGNHTPPHYRFSAYLVAYE